MKWRQIHATQVGAGFQFDAQTSYAASLQSVSQSPQVLTAIQIATEQEIIVLVT